VKRRIAIFLIFAVFASLLSGCGQQSSAENPNETPEIAVCRAQGEAYSEEEFLQGILNKEEDYVAWGITDTWEYYYRPVNIPEGFVLDVILFAGGYLVYRYFNEAGELYEFVWNVTLSEEAVRGKELDIPGAKEDTYIISSSGMSYSEAKNNKEYRESRVDSIYKDGWSVTFIIEGAVFDIGMPFSIPEEDLGKLIQVEKVYINK
jgi:uncharacterized protein YceK